MPSQEEIDRLESFLRPPLIAVAATIGATGMPQLTPVWYEFRDGAMFMSVTKERLKYRNLARDGRMSVCVYDLPFARVYATITGRVELADDDSIWELTRAICERYMAPHEVEPWMQELYGQDRVLITLRPERIHHLDLARILPEG